MPFVPAGRIRRGLPPWRLLGWCGVAGARPLDRVSIRMYDLNYSRYVRAMSRNAGCPTSGVDSRKEALQARGYSPGRLWVLHLGGTYGIE